MVVEDLFRRATEAGLTFSSDNTKPGFEKVQNGLRNLSTDGDFIHMEREWYNNEVDELRALRLHRRRQAADAGAAGAKIVLDPVDHSSLKKRSRPHKHRRAHYHDVREGLYQMVEQDPDGFDLESVDFPRFISEDLAGTEKLIRSVESQVEMVKAGL